MLEKWQPLDGLIDPTPALRLARSLVSREGSVIYLTDSPAESLPFDARLVSVGEAVENVGFTGVSFSTEEGALIWKALVRNYSKTSVERTWSIQTATGGTEPRSIRLDANALVTLQAAFPKDAKNVRIVLSPDRFTLDDTLPLVAPQPKTLALFTATSPAFENLTKKLLRALDSAVATNDAAAADLAITSYDPLDPVLPPGNSVIFVEDNTRTGAYLKGGIVAEPNPLLDHLNWQSLLVRETIQLDRQPSDTVILWQEKRPLIFLREKPASENNPLPASFVLTSISAYQTRKINPPSSSCSIASRNRFGRKKSRRPRSISKLANRSKSPPHRIYRSKEPPPTLAAKRSPPRYPRRRLPERLVFSRSSKTESRC
ncbi:MAG: hypothetical protein HC845_07080 [Akkermansiaceae bacterium]|nr:hypothetical protein [Akkermansiaceae bacterium]